MNLICRHCQSENPSAHLFCANCGDQLISTPEAIARLNNRVTQIEVTYQRQLSEVKSDLQRLTGKALQTELVPEQSTDAMATRVEKTVIPQMANQAITLPQKKVIKEPIKKPIKPKLPREPSVLELQIALLFKPVTDGLNWVNGQYIKYKQEGKLPIFLMTIAGIVAMLFGLGYLMQVTLNKMGIYEPVIKVGLGFCIAMILAVIALRLYRKKDHYNEYASGLASLSIIINYVLLYFLADLGNFPVLSSAILGFVLILLNTAFAIYLSLRFETKIVAVLSLIGGAFAPFFLNSTEDSTFYYGYLWLLVVAANYVAVKIEWKSLHYLSFLIAISLIGMAVFTTSPSSVIFFIYYHLFAYLFFYYSFFKKFQWKSELGKIETFLLAGNMGFFVYSLYAAYDVTLLTLGLTYLANALIFGVGTFLSWENLSDQVKRILPVVIATFLALAIPALLNQGLMGLFWSIEALLLIHLGFTTKLPVVRKEGYLLLLIGLAKIAYSSFFFFDSFNDLAHEGYYNFTALGLVLATLWLQSGYHRRSLQKFEQTFYYLFRNGFPIWLSGWLMITGYQLIGEWMLPFSVVPLFALSWWGSKLKSTFLISFGFIYLLPLLIAFLISASEVGSMYFDEQKLYAQTSLVLFMASLWFMKKYYELLDQKKQGLNGFVHGLRVLFHLIIPLITIAIARRHFPELVPASIWLSMLIAFAFQKKLKYLALQIEFTILFVLAFLAGFVGLSVSTLITGIVAITIVHLAEKSYNLKALVNSDFAVILKISSYIAYLLISILTYRLIDNDLYFFPVVLYCTLLLATVLLKDKLAFIRESTGAAITIAIWLGMMTLAGMLIGRVRWHDISLMLINLVLLGILFLNRKKWYGSFTSFKWSFDFVFFQVMLIMSYWSALMLFNINATGAVMTVLFAIHAVALLFLSLKNKLKLPNYLSIIIFVFTTLKIVFADIASLPTMQKVVVLIALGALLLGASYAYTRLKKYFDDKDASKRPLIAEEKNTQEDHSNDPIS